MLIGMVIFTIGRKHYIHAAQMKPVQEGDTKLSEILIKVFVPAIVAGAIGWFIPKNIFGSDSTDALFLHVFLLFIFMLPFISKLNLMKKLQSVHCCLYFDQYVLLGCFQTKRYSFDKMGQLLYGQKCSCFSGKTIGRHLYG
jgi:hypothetical protein